MHSERVGMSTAALRKGTYEAQRRERQTDNQVLSQPFFSANPMFDKYSYMHGKQMEEKKMRERQTAVIDSKQPVFMPEKYSQRGNHDCSGIPNSFLNNDLLSNFPSHSPMRLHTQQLESGKSSRLLNKFLHQNDTEDANYISGYKISKNSKTPERNPYLANFNEKLTQRYETEKSQKNNSMVSSKSHELMEKIAKRDRRPQQQEAAELGNLPKNKTMTSFTKIFEQNKNSKSSKPNFFIDMGDPDGRSVRRSTTKAPCTPMKSPDDSYIFMDNGDRSYLQNGFNASPAHSAVRMRNTDKSRVSALNRSDLSKTSNANSFMTKRGEDNDFSRVNAQQGESHNRGGMSKTWVKSGLLDSRDDNSSVISSNLKFDSRNCSNEDHGSIWIRGQRRKDEQEEESILRDRKYVLEGHSPVLKR